MSPEAQNDIKMHFYDFYQINLCLPYFISVIYGLSLQLQYGKLEKSLKCQKVWYDFF
jgi:hypothetical protein